MSELEPVSQALGEEIYEVRVSRSRFEKLLEELKNTLAVVYLSQGIATVNIEELYEVTFGRVNASIISKYIFDSFDFVDMVVIDYVYSDDIRIVSRKPFSGYDDALQYLGHAFKEDRVVMVTDPYEVDYIVFTDSLAKMLEW